MERDSLILIPTLKERKNLGKLIPAIFDLMPDISVLVVDDNSNDGTAEFLNSLNYPKLFFLERKNNLGYGKSCIEGFRWFLDKSYKYIVTMDADFSHDYRTIPQMLEKLKSADMIIGSRYITGGKIQNWKWHRKILSRIANYYVRSILRLNIKDVTTGFNAYRKESLAKIDLNKIKSDGYAFLVELKYKLVKSGASFLEYPIVFAERREGQSKMSGKIILESVMLPWHLLNK